MILMNMINRNMLLAIPKKPLIDWAMNVYKDKTDSEERLFESFTTAFLIETDHKGLSANDLSRLRKKYYEDVFEQSLEAWCTDQRTWPDITLLNFKEWFELKVVEEVWDLGEEPIDE